MILSIKRVMEEEDIVLHDINVLHYLVSYRYLIIYLVEKYILLQLLF